MHYIQRHIINQLILHQKRRFSELRHPRVESNLFQYHLKQTIKQGYVRKLEEGGYTLSSTGLFYADRYSSFLKTERLQSKVITVIVVRNCRGEVLLKKRSRQPWVGSYHLPAGKVHLGETTDEAVIREIGEKLDSKVIVEELRLKNVAHVIIRQDGQLVSDYVGFIYGAFYDGPLEEGRWFDEGQSIDLAPSVREVLEIEKFGIFGLHTLVIDKKAQ